MLSKEGKKVARHLGHDIKKTCGYIKLLNRIAHQADEGTLKRLKGSIVDDDSAKGFLFELDMAINFFHQGYDVQFTDLMGSANFDLLVSNDEYEVEVECKRKSIDAGRKIKKGDFYLLADILFDKLGDCQGRFAILIRSSGRMGADPNLYKRVAATVEKLLKAGDDAATIENLELRIEALPGDSVIKTIADAAQAIARFESSFAYYAIFSSRNITFIIKCESANKNEVLEAIYPELKKGASQLSGTRPSFLSCLIEEVEDEDWETLRTGSGLPGIAYRLLANESRRHVNLLAFSSDLTQPVIQNNIVSFWATN